MTSTTLSGGAARSRRHAAHQSVQPVAAPYGPGRQAAAHAEPIGATRARAVDRHGLPDACVAGLACLVMALLHAGVVWFALHPLRARVEPPKPLPMTVELTSSAPVALPQAPASKAAPQPAPPKPQQPMHRSATSRTPARTPTSARAPAPPAKAAKPAVSATPAAADPVAPPTASVAPSQAAVKSPKPAPDTAPVGDAAYLHNPAPDYPAVAQDQGWQGRVLLRVHVLASGQPESITIATSSGRRVLDEAALAAVRHWAFVPAKRGDEAVDGYVTVPLDFKLSN